ncbi:MAG TPA: lytic murein transglycosylase [Mesorhizobium sp.]|jgi:lytic murein transglycosylase|nr:lytic murein transglycosylase [Mesorhizobium sp.]
MRFLRPFAGAAKALAAIGLSALLGGQALAQGADDASFRRWLDADLWPQAQAAGVSRRSFDAAFGGVPLQLDLPDLVVPGKKAGPQKQMQAEFRSPGAYFAEKTVKGVTGGGRARASRHGKTLAAIEKRWGVPGAIVLAIWGRESGFGAADMPHDAFSVLGTKAYLSTRKAMFREELLAALRMVEEGHVARKDMRSSWAGALGQPQFLPSSFLKHAVDFDGDGKKDIWNSVPDSLASIANYLAQFGWQEGRDWGFEVVVPETVSCALEGPDRGKSFAEWERLGITRANGKPLPKAERSKDGFLLMPAGRGGPAFLVTPNFYVLKEYNESDLYALFVGHGADRIRYGDKLFAGRWGKVDGLLRSDVAALQRGLEAQGYDVGGADGLPGFRTRRSIGEWQESQGLAPTCFPSRALVKALG